MSKAITMNLRLDEETRQALKEFAAQIGIPATSLVNASIKQMLRTREVTFNTTPEPTPYLQKIIKEAEIDYTAGKNITRTNSTKETLAHLRSL